MGHIRGAGRSEVLLFPQAIDDYITDDNPVRFIDAFVVSLDLAGLGFARATPAATDRPAYGPADLLKLYVYGYLNRVRSSRMLEREAGRNVEVMWPLKKLTPDFKTTADFRRDNPEAIRQVGSVAKNILATISSVEECTITSISGVDRNFCNTTRHRAGEVRREPLRGRGIASGRLTAFFVSNQFSQRNL